MNIILTNIYLFIMAVVLAVLEIQIEGEHGWAKNLPTWRPKNSSWYTKLYGKIMSGKEMTGYHLSMFSLVFLILFLPFVFGLPLNLENLLKLLATFFLFSALWDFLWFVLNPYYPLKKFKAEYLSFHHKQWFLGVPTDYWGALLVTFLISAIGQFIFKMPDFIKWWGINVGLFVLGIGIVILFSLYILKIDNWHEKAD
ncbi:MAG: hypothetical protein Q7R43_02010 [Candidatus Daviesbacteria bacterium]|nr:hypothetical protein [Candidatus Daviesbacteria bacterium]